MNIAVSMVVLSIGILACQGGGGKKNQRDSKLDAQQQKIEQALHDVESRVGQVVQQAQERYDGVVRSAQQVKRDLGTRADQVDRAAQGMVQQAQKLEQMANTAADKAQSMVGAVETAWGDFQVRRETTPASPR
jgi:hypothetical protein